jgi:hypothetical protein
MKINRVPLTAVVILFLGPLLYSNVSQIRIIAERAAIYIEPNRTSARIEIVEKGTVLTLFQTKKVKDVWYYVSYDSPRYGGRISGFIHESFAEPVTEGGTPGAKSKPPERPEQSKIAPPALTPEPEKKPQEKIRSELPQPVTPAAAEKSPESKVPAATPQQAPVSAAPATPKEEKEALKPARQPGRLEPKKEEESKPAPRAEIPKEMPKIGQVSIGMGLTAVPRRRALGLAGRSMAVNDQPWQIIQPAAPPPAVRLAPPEVKQSQPPRQGVEPAIPRAEAGTRKPEKRKVEAPPVTAKPPVSPPLQVKPRPAPRTWPGRELLKLGLGYGSSYGGAGASLQVGVTPRLALHAGFGLYPTRLIFSETAWVKNETLWSAGIKYYIPVRPGPASAYIDLQYGGLRVEAAQVITGIYEYSYVYSHEQKTLWGPSLLGGIEIRLGRLGLNGGFGFSYNLTEWEYLKHNLSVAFEAGLVIHLGK